MRAAVIEEMPALFDRPVAGILGIDVLQRADRLVMEFPPQAKGPGLLSLQARREPRPSSPRAGEVKFSILQHHLVVPVHVNAKPAYLVLDTGSPDPLLDVQTALDTGVASTVGSEREVGGLDGGKVSSSAGVVRNLEVGGEEYEDVACRIAPLQVFASLRESGQRVGLLGNSFLGRFARVEIDFAENRILFER